MMENPLLVVPERPLPRKVGVVGAGTIGPDIGYYLLSSIADLGLVLVDVAEESLDAATKRIESHVQKGLARDKLTVQQADTVMSGLEATLDYEALADCDWVIEAATEDLPLKRSIFAQIEAVVSESTLITSNTSSLPAERLFSGLEYPERATVTHFFAPAFQNPAVEVVSWAGADPSMIEYLRWVFAVTGKVPLVTTDVVCFMLDRIFDNWCNEAGHLLGQATPAEVDAVAQEFVHAGPFFVLNMANGNPIIVETNTLQMHEEGEHYRPSPVFDSADRWDTASPGDPVSVDPTTAGPVRDRLLGVLWSQSVDIIDRDIGTAADLELGCILALGFKKGPLALMADQSDGEVGRILARFADERAGMPMPQQPLAGYSDFRRHVLVDEIDGVMVITIRRPQALNALDDDVNDELLAVITENEDNPAITGFVITGYGPRAFCAGADIDRFPSMLGKADAAEQYARDCSRLLMHLDAMSKPVVAAINGMALGGGLELAMRCHGIMATEDAWFQLPEVTLGIAPGIGALVVPYRRWPQATPIFADMARLGTKMTSTEASELGVVDGLATGVEELMAMAIARVKALVGRVTPIPDGPIEIPALTEVAGSEVIDIIEHAIRDGAAAPTLDEALEIGYRAFGATACTDTAREKITEFVSR
ncbi:MAG: 3-hydroxyacyl-CoA dehydrogenase/enoyl-CoA hydratase family protein [Actinomycetia bacterium]|nr:3-hydroxyacyl-CoA dehydrogenase/enoyl-CoA hydratase family protein [Actinomycetes bacterium]